jgi:hypothetical protein
MYEFTWRTAPFIMLCPVANAAFSGGMGVVG